MDYKRVLTVQDILGLDDSARVNVPGTMSNKNWTWKLTDFDAFKERMDFYDKQGEKVLYAKSMRSYCRVIVRNYLLIKDNFPNEKEKLRELKIKMKKQALKMLFLPGNSIKQKISAIMFAYFPVIWSKIYKNMVKSNI